MAACASAPETAIEPSGSEPAQAADTTVAATVASVGTAGSSAPTTVAPPTTTSAVQPETTPVPDTTATTAVAATTTTVLQPPGQDVLQAIAAYTGATPGTADPANGTIGVGWVNQEGSAPSFSEATVGFASAVQYLNLHLNGVQGRVIELHQCAIRREADAAVCAQQLRDDPAVSVVVVGVTTIGNQALLDGLKDIKPVVLASPLATADFLATDAVAFTPGSPGVIAGLTRFAAERLPGGPPAKVAVVYPYGLAGEISYQLLAKPVLDKFGIASVGVPVIESAAPAQFAPRFTDAGAADASAVLAIVGTRGCIGVDQALRDLASTATVLATDACRSAAMTAHVADVGGLGDFPDQWYVGSNGFRVGVEGNADVDAYLEIVVEYLRQVGLPLPDLTNYAASSFSSMLAVARLFHQVGPDNATPEAMRAATRAFGGPTWLVTGPMRCGFNAFYPTLCGTQMGVEQYVGGAWQPVADGHTGSPIELSDLTGG